jgi:hypothetical protein
MTDKSLRLRCLSFSSKACVSPGCCLGFGDLRFSESFYWNYYKILNSYLDFSKKLEDEHDLINGLIHLQAAYHNFDYVVYRIRRVDVGLDFFLFGLLIPE